MKKPEAGLAEIAERMACIRHKILVLSGKGGVGKSTVASCLARALADQGDTVGQSLLRLIRQFQDESKRRQVALLDIDICGPSQPRVMGVESATVHQSASGWQPVYVQDNLAVMSIGFLLGASADAVIWRGPRKNGLIKQFLQDVDWGDVDCLIVDTPPGTSDEHISIVQYLLKVDFIHHPFNSIQTTSITGALLVTTPQEVSLLDVRKEANFCVKTRVPLLGVVENMSTFVCPCCNTASQLFPPTTGGAARMAEQLGVPLLGEFSNDHFIYFHFQRNCHSTRVSPRAWTPARTT